MRIKNLFVDSWGLTGFAYACIFIFIIAGVIWGLSALGYKQSCYQARIYNQQNQTHWTCTDFFWAGEQINSQSQTIKLDK